MHSKQNCEIQKARRNWSHMCNMAYPIFKEVYNIYVKQDFRSLFLFLCPKYIIICIKVYDK